MDRFRPNQRVTHRELNYLYEETRSNRVTATGNGVTIGRTPAGMTVSLSPQRRATLMCLVTDKGPNGEDDYTDARYWVREMACTNASGDASAPLTLEYANALDVDGNIIGELPEEDIVEGDAKAAQPSAPIVWGFWEVATNLAELSANSHKLTSGTPVQVMSFYDSRDDGNLHHIFSTSPTNATSRAGIITDVTENTGYGDDRHTYMGVYLDAPHEFPNGQKWLTPSWDADKNEIKWTEVQISDLRGDDTGVHYIALTACTANTYTGGDVVDVVFEFKKITDTDAGQPEIWMHVPIGIRSPEAIEHVVTL